MSILHSLGSYSLTCLFIHLFCAVEFWALSNADIICINFFMSSYYTRQPHQTRTISNVVIYYIFRAPQNHLFLRLLEVSNCLIYYKVIFLGMFRLIGAIFVLTVLASSLNATSKYQYN